MAAFLVGGKADDSGNGFHGEHQAAFRNRQSDFLLSLQGAEQLALVFDGKIPISGAVPGAQIQVIFSGLLQKGFFTAVTPTLDRFGGTGLQNHGHGHIGNLTAANPLIHPDSQRGSKKKNLPAMM